MSLVLQAVTLPNGTEITYYYLNSTFTLVSIAALMPNFQQLMKWGCQKSDIFLLRGSSHITHGPLAMQFNIED
jgi:hypothetical protein